MSNTTEAVDLAAWLTRIWDEEERIAGEDLAPDWIATITARIAADRKILALHQPDRGADTWYWLERECAGCGRRWHGNTPPGTPPTVIGPERGCPTVRLLASAYADLPGFQEAWR